jgi:hypothetical protein
MCGKPFVDWQQSGFDNGTTLAAWPPSPQIIAWDRALLGL